MSYINDALKKVQKEKDSLYQHYDNIISGHVYRRTGRGKRWIIASSVIVLILLALPVFILLRYNASSGTGNNSMGIIQKVPEIPVKTENVERLYSKALNYQQNSNPTMAEKVYRKILAIDPGFVMGLNNLGVICMSRKENKEAADMFRKAIDLKADYVDPYYNLACLYSLSGNISKSLYYLKMAVSINNSVKNWAKNDKDLEGLRVSETYKKIMERF